MIRPQETAAEVDSYPSYVQTQLICFLLTFVLVSFILANGVPILPTFQVSIQVHTLKCCSSRPRSRPHFFFHPCLQALGESQGQIQAAPLLRTSGWRIWVNILAIQGLSRLAQIFLSLGK